MLVNLLLGLALTLALLIPGAAVALCWAPSPGGEDHEGESPLAHALLACGWSFGLVPYLAFCYVLVSGQGLTAPVTLGAAAAVTVAALCWWWLRRGRAVPVQLRRGWRGAAPVLGASAAVALIYLLKYDRSVFAEQSCLFQLVMDTLGLGDSSPAGLLASRQDDQRLGNTAVISSFVALYGRLGFRVLYGMVGFFMALGGYVLGRRVLGHRGWGWFVLLALPLNPYVAKIPLLDENLLTLGYSALFLPLIWSRRVPWIHVGALLGLAVMMRHIGVLWLPAVAWALWRHEGHRLRALLGAFVAFNLVTVVGHVHHAVAYGSVLTFESYGQMPATVHRLIGPYHGLLQWPFAEQVVRTPWNPLPTFLMWPVYVAGHLGLALWAALLLGAVAMLRTDRRAGLFWLLWLGPAWLALSLQENWDVPNKMGVIYVLFPPLVLWAGAGLQAALRCPRRWGAALLAVALASGLGMWALRGLEVPVDARYYQVWPNERPEDPAFLRAERRRVTPLTPWPDYSRVGEAAPLWHPAKLAGLLTDLEDPRVERTTVPYGWFSGDAVDLSGQPVTLELDLSARLLGRDPGWIRRAGAAATVDLDLSKQGPPKAIPGVRLPWSRRRATLLLSGGRAAVTSVMIIFEPWDPVSAEGLGSQHDLYLRSLGLLLGWRAADIKRIQTVTHSDIHSGVRLRLRVLPGPLSIVEALNNTGHRYLLWKTRVAPAGEVKLDGPYHVFHN